MKLFVSGLIFGMIGFLLLISFDERDTITGTSEFDAAGSALTGACLMPQTDRQAAVENTVLESQKDGDTVLDLIKRSFDQQVAKLSAAAIQFKQYVYNEFTASLQQIEVDLSDTFSELVHPHAPLYAQKDSTHSDVILQ